MIRIVRELNQCTANGEVYYLTDEEYAQATSYGMKYDTVKRVKVPLQFPSWLKYVKLQK